MKMKTKQIYKNNKELIKTLTRLNKSQYVEVQGTKKKRLVFDNSDEMFKLFGQEEKRVLTPFNDYTYEWLNSLISNLIDFLEQDKDNTIEDFEENIHEYIYHISLIAYNALLIIKEFE